MNPDMCGDEHTVLLDFLGVLRASIAAKADGVPEPAVRAPGVESGTNLLGLIAHLTASERFWFLGEDVTDWRSTMNAPAAQSAADVLAAYRTAAEQADEVVRGYADLDAPALIRLRGGPPSMRWVLVHMIEETARHAGHADILRERLDNSTGR